MNDINAIKNGDDVAFESVYGQYHVKVFRFFLKRTKVHDTARELTQQAFIRLWQYRHTLSDLHTLDTQLFTIAVSTLVDHLRKAATQSKRATVLLTEIDEEVHHTPATSVFEAMDYMHAMVSGLPPVRRKVILLRMEQGYSNKEIAQELCISVKTVEDHVTKALRSLRTIVSILVIWIICWWS